MSDITPEVIANHGLDADEYADIPTQGEEQTREDWLGALDQRQRQ